MITAPLILSILSILFLSSIRVYLRSFAANHEPAFSAVAPFPAAGLPSRRLKSP
jgi:hypothetical protein